MSNLKRITTEYNEREDRIRLAGITDDNQTIALWLTMRLVSRLVSHCLNLLEKSTPEATKVSTADEQSRKSIQNFVQQSAEQQLVEEAAVKVTKNSPKYLAAEIDVKSDHAGVTIIFKGEFSSNYSIYLNNQQLRQWLGMLHMIWQKTEWSTLIWPDWMSSSSLEATSSATSIH
ncbi:MAG: hypothetical protein ACJZ8M_07360 [Pseudohongiellaceae bacterium]